MYSQLDYEPLIQRGEQIHDFKKGIRSARWSKPIPLQELATILTEEMPYEDLKELVDILNERWQKDKRD